MPKHRKLATEDRFTARGNRYVVDRIIPLGFPHGAESELTAICRDLDNPFATEQWFKVSALEAQHNA